MENKYEEYTNNNDNNLYSIKISNNEMWIKNKINSENYNFISIKNINLKNMNANNIKILLIDENSNKFIVANKGQIKNNLFKLKNVKFYDLKNENFEILSDFELILNFDKDNLINSVSKYKLIPYYNYISHSNTLNKFNLYSAEIGLYYLSEVLKPLFIVMLSFIILGFSGKFKRNENFFKVLFISILIGFIVFLYKEIVTKITITLSFNFIFAYLLIFLIPFFIGLYQVVKIENE